jgi:hypothetical protein
VATSQGDWQIPLLETDEEFEEQLALHNPSPDLAHLQHHMQQPWPGNSSAATNVYRNLFPPAGNSHLGQLQHFLTGTPPNCLAASLILPVMNSQQRGQHSGGQQLFASLAMADDPYDACLQNILDGEDDPSISTQHDQQQQGKRLFSLLSSMGQGLPGGRNTVPPASSWANLSLAPPAGKFQDYVRHSWSFSQNFIIFYYTNKYIVLKPLVSIYF